VDIKVESGEFPLVEITAPLLGADVPAGLNLEILVNASDPDFDGQITAVEVFNGSELLGSATPTGVPDQYRLNLTPSVADAGVLNLIARATDDRGNSTDSAVVEVMVKIVQFSVGFTLPTASPYLIEGDANQSTSAVGSFTVEVGGLNSSTLASLDWQLDNGSAAVSQTLVAGVLIYSQDFGFSDTSTLTVTATNSDGSSVQTSLTVFVDLPDPSPGGDLTDFVNYIYDQVQGLVPSAEELQDAIDAITALGGDTAANRAAFAATLFTSDQYNNSRYQTVALVYKTLTGQWPTQSQLETGLNTIIQDSAVQSDQTILSQEGSISAGATQVLSFNYSRGDTVTITVNGNGTNGPALTDPTLTVRAPDGSYVGFSDDSFASRNPSLSFIASQTGAYTATVGGYFTFLSGGFVATSTSTSSVYDSNTVAARALVESLKGSYNGANGFLADTDTGSFNLSPTFVAQIYLNKHGVDISDFNASTLGTRLLGVNEDMGNGYILPGYQSNVVNFVADFALDVDLATGPLASIPTSDGYPYSGTVYYGRPNNPLSSWYQARAAVQSDANLSFALSAFLGSQNPADTDLAPYAGMTLEQALAEIFGSVEFDGQFVGDTRVVNTDGDGSTNYYELLLGTDPSDGSVEPTAEDSFVAQRMVDDYGVVDSDKVAADDDADGDGASNITEILLNTDPSNIDDNPTTGDQSSSFESPNFFFEFVRLKSDLITPDMPSVVVECAGVDMAFMPVSDLESKLSSATNQSGIGSDYERFEFRVDVNDTICAFFRLKVE
jgi:hypothetical protein